MKPTLVVLTGAGISAGSGLKTFRDEDGLWEGYKFEEVATVDAFQRNPGMVLEFYNQRREAVLKAKPNQAHLALAELEKGFDVKIITQNIDDLHERAGSNNIVHLHGEILKMRPANNPEGIVESLHPLNFGDCNGENIQWRPHVVWFGESVPLMNLAIDLVQDADAFVIIGTSLNVYPAAGLMYDVPVACPIFVLDKKIPNIRLSKKIQTIEKPATEGISELVVMLKDTFKML